VTHLEHTCFFAAFHFRDRSVKLASFFLFLSFFLSPCNASTRDDVKLIGEEQGGSYNNTSADVARCIGSTVRDRNEIVGSNTFAIEGFFLEHDDNDRGRRSTLSKYCRKNTFLYYLYSIYSWVDPSSWIFLVETLYHIFSLDTVSRHCLVSLILYSTLKITYVLSYALVYTHNCLFINTVHAETLKLSKKHVVTEFLCNIQFFY